MQKTSSDIIIFILVSSGLILILTLFVVVILFLYKKKQILHHQLVEQIKLDHEKNLLQSQVEVQEHTFSHISTEIHDNISLALTLAKMQLTQLQESDRNDAPCEVNYAADLVSGSITDLSNISRSLNPEIIGQIGLLEALKKELDRVNNLRMYEVELKTVGEPVFLESGKELTIYRIVQEGLNNILKHARGNKIFLALIYHSEYLEVTLCDNGVGFETNKPVKIGSAGLNNMYSRAKTLNGEIRIESKIREGTTLKLIVPYH